MSNMISIVIPCRNEKNYIASCIDSILSQNYPEKEIIVCDGKSDDGTELILEQYHRENKIILIENEKQTTPFALNLGIKKAKGEIIIIFGAHATMHPNYIDNAKKCFKIDDAIACVGGIIININENKTSEIISKSMSSPFGVGNAYFRTGTKSGFVDTVAFGAYKKDIFKNIGYFDEALTRNQDDEFNFRIIKNGYKIYLSPDIISNYYVRASYLKLFKQYYQYGYWKVFVNKKHRTITTFRQLAPFFFIVFLFFGITASLVHPIMLLIFLLFLAVYFLLGLIAANKVCSQKKNIPAIVYVFFILHVGYGLGYLKGIIHFILLNKKTTKEAISITR